MRPDNKCGSLDLEMPGGQEFIVTMQTEACSVYHSHARPPQSGCLSARLGGILIQRCREGENEQIMGYPQEQKEALLKDAATAQ